jgi:hypothetical protein
MIKNKIIEKVQQHFPDVEKLTITAMTQEDN